MLIDQNIVMETMVAVISHKCGLEMCDRKTLASQTMVYIYKYSDFVTPLTNKCDQTSVQCIVIHHVA